MKGFEVERLGAGRHQLWDAFVEDHPQGTVFHTTRWLGRQPGELVVLAGFGGGGALQGGLAAVRWRRIGISGFHVPPLTAYASPLLSQSRRERGVSARSETMARIGALLGALPPAGAIELVLPAGETDAVAYAVSGFSVGLQPTHELRGDYESFLAGMAKTKRHDLRRAHEMSAHGELVLRETTSIEDLLPLLTDTAKLKGFHLSASALRRLFPGGDRELSWGVFVAEERGVALAGTLMLEDRNRAYYLLGGLSRSRRGSRDAAGLLCLDAMVRRCLDAGKVFDFEGSVLPPVEAFFRLVGGQPAVRLRAQKARSPLYFLARSIRQYQREAAAPRFVD
jgi:hypothetical protein